MVRQKSFFLSFISLLLILAAFFFIQFTKDSTIKHIKRNLTILSSVVSKRADPPLPFVTLLNVTKKIMATPCQLIVEERELAGNYTPEQLAVLINRFRGQVVTSTLSFYDVNISFPQKGKALIHCTARLKGKTLARDSFDEFREFKIIAQRVKGRWRFTRFQEIEGLEK